MSDNMESRDKDPPENPWISYREIMGFGASLQGGTFPTPYPPKQGPDPADLVERFRGLLDKGFGPHSSGLPINYLQDRPVNVLVVEGESPKHDQQRQMAISLSVLSTLPARMTLRELLYVLVDPGQEDNSAELQLSRFLATHCRNVEMVKILFSEEEETIYDPHHEGGLIQHIRDQVRVLERHLGRSLKCHIMRASSAPQSQFVLVEDGNPSTE